jgi:hypothetical protein
VAVGVQPDAEHDCLAFFLLRRVRHEFKLIAAAVAVKRRAERSWIFNPSHREPARSRVQLDTVLTKPRHADVAPTGNRLYRGLAARRAPPCSWLADCQSATQPTTSRRYLKNDVQMRPRGQRLAAPCLTEKDHTLQCSGSRKNSFNQHAF